MRAALKRLQHVRTGVWWARYHAAMTVFWMVMVPVSIGTGLWRRIEYVTFLSLWALVITEWGAWQASRAEVEASRR